MSNHSELGVGLHYLNPVVPHILCFPNSVRAGTEIYVEGQVPYGAGRFIFELYKDNAYFIPFHFNPRFDENPQSIVMTTRADGDWSPIEFITPEIFPFIYETKFRAIVKVTEECYKVTVDDKPIVEFKHRYPIDTANYFCIRGEVKITRVSFRESLTPTMTATLPSTLSVGDKLIVTGHPIGTASSFDVWVQNQKVDFNIANYVNLAFNPRLNIGAVIRTSRMVKWDVEEKEGGMPFSNEVKFKLTIAVLRDHFQILINDKEFTTYKHKLDFHFAKFLAIYRDISLDNVIIESS